MFFRGEFEEFFGEIGESQSQIITFREFEAQCVFHIALQLHEMVLSLVFKRLLRY